MAVLSTADVCEVLCNGTLEVNGRLLDASNASFLASVELGGIAIECVYKPIRGERPLWDFPEGTLAAREVAAWELSEVAGWGVVPPTVLRPDGRFGEGMCQAWIDVDPEQELIALIGVDEDLDGRLPVLWAEDATGDPVVLVHADDPQLRSMAVFDVLVNNADRKGGHILPDASGRVRGCDHGVSFHEDPKLRTILWGWTGEPLRDEDTETLERLRHVLDGPATRLDRVGRHLSRVEQAALLARTRRLLRAGRMPAPSGQWRAIPWPVL